MNGKRKACEDVAEEETRDLSERFLSAKVRNFKFILKAIGQLLQSLKQESGIILFAF